MILARRLELQLAEMNKGDAPEAPVDDAKAKAATPTATTPVHRADTPVAENEDDKERAIAKAALTIAELSQCPFLSTIPIAVISFPQPCSFPSQRACKHGWYKRR